MIFTYLNPCFKLTFTALLVMSASMCCGYSATQQQKVVYIHTEEYDDGENEGIIATNLGLVGFIVDEWGDNSLDLIPNKGDFLELFQEEDDDIWGFRHNISGNLIYVYELGFSDLKHYRIKKYDSKMDIVQLDDGKFYQIVYDDEVYETSDWKKGQKVWVVACRWNDSLQFLLNIDTNEIREVETQ